MDILAVYEPRSHSYDQGWIDAFRDAGARVASIGQPRPRGDLTVILHSVTAQRGHEIPEWVFKLGGRVLLMLTNEFKRFDQRSAWAKKLNATVGTKLPLARAAELYGVPVIQTLHGLDPKRFFPVDGPRAFDIGVRGAHYPANLIGDNDRARICNPSLWSGLKTDIQMGEILHWEQWAKALRTWRTMPSTEAGMVGIKEISSRHFEAIGTHTCLVMYPGEFNGILTEEHYIRLEKDHSNLGMVKDKIRDVSFCEQMVRRAREYLMDCHTYAHRVEQIKKWVSATG